MLQEMMTRIDRLEEALARTVRVGHVVGVDEGRGTVRVRFGDADGLVSHDLPVLVAKSHADKCLHMPDLGEHVVCVFLPSGQEAGFVLGAFYSGGDAVPVASRDTRRVHFADGSWFEYDRAAHVLRGHVVNGDTELVVDNAATLTAGVSAAVKAPTIYLMGNVSQTGRDGGRGAEIKDADTTHTGSYRLVGVLDVDQLVVRQDAGVGGSLTTAGNSHAGTRSGGSI
ncbi:phage baseplate assembly protein V [Pseudodesulfovibrio pelocollis]|uniref:phage baseplate assembly protein V n=1 Tax=Pseudodesulfovibrio pelocollis TaxID=3051432 RepID=UPI00255AE1AF|nr:phage baseplate assembly protein V [Pseudodesulfovibrio sp. SB368]